MFLKNKNIIFKIRRSKVTDYAALRSIVLQVHSKVSGREESGESVHMCTISPEHWHGIDI